MGNINKYDYEASNANVDPVALAEEKAKNLKIKRRMLFLFKTFVCHLVAVAIYLVVFANTGNFESYYDASEERRVLIIFSLIAVALFGAVCAVELARNASAREKFIKDKPFGTKKIFLLAKDGVVTYSLMYLIFQLPAAIYHLFSGYDYVEPSVFEYFYVLDMGMMELTRIGFVGAIANTLVFAATLFVSRLYFCRRWQSDEEKFDKEQKMKRRYG